jgi:hypothetical protein
MIIGKVEVLTPRLDFQRSVEIGKLLFSVENRAFKKL